MTEHDIAILQIGARFQGSRWVHADGSPALAKDDSLHAERDAQGVVTIRCGDNFEGRRCVLSAEEKQALIVFLSEE